MGESSVRKLKGQATGGVAVSVFADSSDFVLPWGWFARCNVTLPSSPGIRDVVHGSIPVFYRYGYQYRFWTPCRGRRIPKSCRHGIQ